MLQIFLNEYDLILALDIPQLITSLNEFQNRLNLELNDSNRQKLDFLNAVSIERMQEDQHWLNNFDFFNLLEIKKNLQAILKKFSHSLAIELKQNGDRLLQYLEMKTKLWQGYHLIFEAENNKQGEEKVCTGCEIILEVIEADINSLSKSELQFIHESIQKVRDRYKSKQLNRFCFAILGAIAEFEREKIEKIAQSLFPDSETYEYMKYQGELFDRKLPELLLNYKGMYVFFKDGEVLDADEDEETLLDRVETKYGLQPMLIEQVLPK